jgi:hypothetical protein
MIVNSARRLALALGLVCMIGSIPGCADYSNRKVDITTIEDDAVLTPDTPIILPLNSQNQVKLYDHWYEIYGDAAQVDEFLARRARRYKALYVEHGIEREKKMVNGECILVYPVEVIIEPQARARTGAVSRLTRMCNEHGFYNVRVRREGELDTTRG